MASAYGSDHDIEAAKSKSDENRGTALLEASALLLLWSVLVINEGSIRFIESEPSVDLLASGRPPAFIRFLGGLFEVFFGLIGTFLGLAAFLKKYHNENVTKISMVIQTILGYYVFIVFVFIQPIYRAVDAEPFSTLTLGQTRFLITLGILTSFHFCLALQGGQFVFMARLVTAATGKDFLKQKSGARMRAMFWNSNMAFSGLWTLITGILINANIGGGKIDAPFGSPPNVGRLPGFTISTGITLLVWGLIGVGFALMRWELPTWYYIGCGYVYVIALLNYGILQFAFIDPNNSGPPGGRAAGGPIALHNGLVFMVVFIATYFSHLACEEHKAVAA